MGAIKSLIIELEETEIVWNLKMDQWDDLDESGDVDGPEFRALNLELEPMTVRILYLRSILNIDSRPSRHEPFKFSA